MIRTHRSQLFSAVESGSPAEPQRVLGVIPARLHSTRLERKMLREIAGEPMLAWVYRAARACSQLHQVLIATDADEIMALAQRYGFPAIFTPDDCASGTDRVHAVAQSIAADIYVNIQGDEPLLRPEHLDALLAPMLVAPASTGTTAPSWLTVTPAPTASPQRTVTPPPTAAPQPPVTPAPLALTTAPATTQPPLPVVPSAPTQSSHPIPPEPHSIEVATLSTPCPANQIHSPHTVKVVADATGRALYFSRAAIPFDRDAVGFTGYMKHLGIYAYRKRALDRFPTLPHSQLESIEKLEQLRFLENGIPIHVSQTPHDTRGVDTEEDLAAVEALLAARLQG